MTDPREPSQMERVQAMLLRGPVCATTFLANYMSSARSRVAELRAAGWAIESPVCSLGHNHKTRQIMYRLVHGHGCRCPRCRESLWYRVEHTQMGLLDGPPSDWTPEATYEAVLA